MKTKNTKGAGWLLGLSAVALASGSLGSLVRAQDTMDDSTSTDTQTTTSTDDMDSAGNVVAGAGAGMDSDGGMMDARMKNAQMLIKTLSEEKTEINTLAAQQVMFKKLGGRENLRLAAMWGRWIREHKAAGPALMKLIKQNGGDPMAAKILKAPVLGGQQKMIDVTHKDHEAAVMTSQMRHNMTGSGAIKTAMHKRANLARKHIRQMAPYHDKHNMMEMDKRSVQG